MALLVHTALGILRDSRPLSYQMVGAERAPVASRYDLRGSAYGFALGDYDRARPLIIDPALAYSTLLGGSGSDGGAHIAVDQEGNAYVTGSSASSDFPTTAGTFDEMHNGSNDVFVTKLNATGSAVLYSTYIGGSAGDNGAAVAIDAEGNAYLTGSTGSTNFPTTPGAYDTSYNGGGDAFVAKLDPSGSVLLYSTYLGGSVTTTFGPGPIDGGADIAVDAGGNAYVTGSTASANFPTTAGAFDTTHAADGSFDGFVTKIDASGATLVYSTFLGGAAGDGAADIAVDADGHAYVAGTSDSRTTFPTTPGAWKTTSAFTQNVFVSKLNAAGSGLVYSTFLIEAATAHGLAIDAEGNAYGLGHTATAGQATPGAFDTTLAGSDAFVAKLNALGSERVYGTYLGGAGGDQPADIAVDAAGNAHVTGTTGSADFPTTSDAFDPTHNGSNDVFLTKLNAAGSALLYSTFFGGAGGESGNAIAIDAAGDAYVTGFVLSGGFPTTPGAFDTSFGGGNSDAFVAKFELASPPATVVLAPETDTNPVGTSHTVTATVEDASGRAVGDVIVRFSVTGSVTESGSCTTDDAGQCSFTYAGPTVPGSDTITAFADSDGNGFQGSEEPGGFASKTWVPGTPAAVALAPATAENPVGTSHTVTAMVVDAFGSPVPGMSVRFGVTGSMSAAGQCTTDLTGQCSFSYAGPTAPGSDAITAFADSDRDGVQGLGEPSAAATKTWVPGPPATVTVTPAAADNPVGTEHCVTATVADSFGNAVPGVTVLFTVSGAVETTGTGTTATLGQATFCYIGPELPGADEITAHADTDGDGALDEGEPIGGATKSWVLPESTPGQVAGGGHVAGSAGAEEIAFGFSARSEDGSLKGHCNVIDRAADVRIKCLDVVAFVRDGTHATVFGNATINQTETTYRLELDDLADPGAGHDTFQILTDSGYTAGGVLTRGNVQIR